MVQVRVLYRPPARAGWMYGWTFVSPTLDAAKTTVQRVTRRDRLRELEYRVEAVDPADVDAYTVEE